MEPQSSYDPLRRDGVSPHLRLAPALMHIENLSLQSLARSTRGVGVTDLRDALDGRSSMSNPALVNKAPSVSTLDQASTHVDTSNKLRPVRSKPEKLKVAGGASEVRDMLSKLHIGKSNNGSNLLRASFPGLQKQEARSVRLSCDTRGFEDSDVCALASSAKLHPMCLHTSHRLPPRHTHPISRVQREKMNRA
jgi:protein EFR3